MSNTLPSRGVPVKVEVLFISTHQLHFGLLQGPQLPEVVVCPSGVLPVNLVLTSMSRRLFDRLYAIIGRSLNMWASLFFDWRKCQFLLPPQQYMRCVDCMWLLRVCGWWCASLSSASSRLVSVTKLCAFQIAPYLFYTHTPRKNWNIPIFFALARALMSISS